MKTIFRKNNLLLSKSSQSGFSLIEVLVAALILSTAILGLASLQIISMKGTFQSLMKLQAKNIVHNTIERMRVNHAGVIAGDYVLDNTFNCSVALPDCSTTKCTSAQIALVDQHNLVCGYGANPSTGGIRLRSAMDNIYLVNGTLNITCNGATAAIGCSQGDVTITVGWTERALGKEVPAASDSLSIDTRIAAP